MAEFKTDGEEKSKKLKDDIERKDDDEFLLSEDLLLLTTNTSNESSKDKEKKKRKFKPGKFISKHLKIKRAIDIEKLKSNGNSEVNDGAQSKFQSTEGQKMNSPKLDSLRRTFAKRFSRKKVSPLESNENVSKNEKPLNNERVLKEIAEISKSDPNISNTNSIETIVQHNQINEFSKSMQTVDKKFVISKNSASTASSFSQNKKVQLKITISGKKVEKVNTSASEIKTVTTKTIVDENEIDKASALQNKSRTDIILPTTSTTVRISTSRDDFLNVMVPSRNANLHVQQQHQTEAKSSSCNVLSQSVPRTTAVKSGDQQIISTSEKEIEKYLVLTSSLNSIISAAKDLDNLNSTQLKSTENFTELKIYENPIEVHDQKSNIEKKKQMSENMKQSKIPVNKRRSVSSDILAEKDNNPSTVHTQEAHQPYHLNLRTSASTEELTYNASTVTMPSSSELKVETIEFELGTPVRPFILSSASSNITAPIITETATSPESEEFYSPMSDPCVTTQKRDSTTRRKIAYIPQLTIYTQEEQELLKSNIIANSESFDTVSLPPDSSIFPMFDENISVSNMTPSTPEKRECLFKILVIGELGTGKTSFIKRYVHQFFSQNYRATIGVDFALKVLSWDESTIIRLQLWDIAGQERFGNMTRVYYKEAVGSFIVFDVTRTATFDAVSKWKQDLDSKVQLPDGSPIPCILLANKCDQQKQGLVTMPAKMDEYCRQNGFAGWFETSAKENTNIEESAKALVSKILVNDKLIHNDMLDGDRFVLDAEDAEKQKKFCSC